MFDGHMFILFYLSFVVYYFLLLFCMLFFFFFQEEDGIRDHCVTGVQTCALPISSSRLVLVCVSAAKFAPVMVAMETNTSSGTQIGRIGSSPTIKIRSSIAHPAAFTAKIGRASCRERA